MEGLRQLPIAHKLVLYRPRGARSEAQRAEHIYRRAVQPTGSAA